MPLRLYRVPEGGRRHIAWVVRWVGEVNNARTVCNSRQRVVALRPTGTPLPDPIAEPRLAVCGTNMEALTVPAAENAEGRLTQPRRLLQHCIEHRCQIARRGIDDL